MGVREIVKKTLWVQLKDHNSHHICTKFEVMKKGRSRNRNRIEEIRGKTTKRRERKGVQSCSKMWQNMEEQSNQHDCSTAKIQIPNPNNTHFIWMTSLSTLPTPFFHTPKPNQTQPTKKFPFFFVFF